jgi:hypothetical protein
MTSQGIREPSSAEHSITTTFCSPVIKRGDFST